MKTKLHSLFIVLALSAGLPQVTAQGTAFTYQGRLNNAGSAASGFVVLFPDSFGSRGIGSQCRETNRMIHASRERVSDANAARGVES